MKSKELAPELGTQTDCLIRTAKDGTRRYYRNGKLHRNPYEGPAIERPGHDDISEYHVNGEILPQRFFHGLIFQTLEAVLRYKENTESAHSKVARANISVGSAKPVDEGLAPPKNPKQVTYLPVITDEATPQTKVKHRDRFDKLSHRMKGTSMNDLQKLYDELSVEKKKGNTHNDY